MAMSQLYPRIVPQGQGHVGNPMASAQAQPPAIGSHLPAKPASSGTVAKPAPPKAPAKPGPPAYVDPEVPPPYVEPSLQAYMEPPRYKTPPPPGYQEPVPPAYRNPELPGYEQAAEMSKEKATADLLPPAYPDAGAAEAEGPPAYKVTQGCVRGFPSATFDFC